MKNYKVIWREAALNDLADIWLRTTDREAVNQAVTEIESRLEESPTEWGRELREGLRSFRWESLRVLYYVIKESKTVRIVAAIWGAASEGNGGVDF